MPSSDSLCSLSFLPRQTLQWHGHVVWPYYQLRMGSALSVSLVCRSRWFPADISWAEQWPLSTEQHVGEEVGGGRHCSSALHHCPPAWLPLPVRAEVSLTEEQEDIPRERMFMTCFLLGQYMSPECLMLVEVADADGNFVVFSAVTTRDRGINCVLFSPRIPDSFCPKLLVV